MTLGWEHLVAFNIAILGALLSPGPAWVMVLRSSLGRGRRAGLACAAGLAVGATIWGAVALVGLTALFALVPWAYLTIKIAGAAYLLWFAVRLWRGADRPVETSAIGPGGFWTGCLTNLLNPKVVFFLAAIYATVFPTMPAGRDAVVVLVNHGLLELGFYTGSVLLLTTAPARAAYARLKSVFDRAAAAVLVALSARLLLERT